MAGVFGVCFVFPVLLVSDPKSEYPNAAFARSDTSLGPKLLTQNHGGREGVGGWGGGGALGTASKATERRRKAHGRRAW